MARRAAKTLTEVELEFMQILWSTEEATPEEVRQVLIARDRTLTDGSVRKILSILVDKGYATRERQGKSFHYRAAVVRNEARGKLVEDLLSRAFGGSAVNMVAALLDDRSLDAEELNAIKQILAEHEGRRGK